MYESFLAVEAFIFCLVNINAFGLAFNIVNDALAFLCTCFSGDEVCVVIHIQG